MTRRSGECPKGRELRLNVEKSNVLILYKESGTKKGKKTLEEAKKFKYLGYNLQKNGGRESRVEEVGKRARTVMAQIWAKKVEKQH